MGAWHKMRINQGQEFVIGGYTVGGKSFDALLFGYFQEGNLIYAARTRNGFTPKLRAELMKRSKTLETKECPFANRPEKRASSTVNELVGHGAAKVSDHKVGTTIVSPYRRWYYGVTLVSCQMSLNWGLDSHTR